MIIVENNYYVFLPHANSIPSLAKVENETPHHCRQEPAPGEMHEQVTEINSLHNGLLLLR